MPASQEVRTTHGLKFSVRPVEKPSPVFFTQESPEFEIKISNESKYDFTRHSKFVWRIKIDNIIPHKETAEFGPLDKGDSETIRVQSNLLAAEGHGILGISTGGVIHGGEGTARLKSGSSLSTHPAYTFSVWDESHYEAQIRRPQKLQKANLVLSGALIFFALVQIAIAILQYGQ